MLVVVLHMSAVPKPCAEMKVAAWLALAESNVVAAAAITKGFKDHPPLN